MFAAVGEQVVHKVTLYPAGWVHTLKVVGLPPLFVPAAATNQWIGKQLATLNSVVNALTRQEPQFLGGIRVEVRTNGGFTTWPSLHDWLTSVLGHVMLRFTARLIPTQSLIQASTAALASAHAAHVAGSPAGSLASQCPAWKRKSFYRLLQCMGIMNAGAAKMAYHADVNQLPWGDPSALAVPTPLARPLTTNPFLSSAITRVYIPSTALPAGIAKIGKAQSP